MRSGAGGKGSATNSDLRIFYEKNVSKTLTVCRLQADKSQTYCFAINNCVDDCNCLVTILATVWCLHY